MFFDDQDFFEVKFLGNVEIIYDHHPCHDDGQ